MVGDYYIPRKDSLMRHYDKVSKGLEQVTTARYDAEFASVIRKEARQEFEALIPQLPYIGGKKNRLTTVWSTCAQPPKSSPSANWPDCET